MFLLPSTSLSLPKLQIPKDVFQTFTSQTSSKSPVPHVDIAPRVVNIGVGKQQISAILDINNQLIWNICVPSNNTSIFYNPSNSSTFSNISCASCPSFVTPNCKEQCNYNNKVANSTNIDTWGVYGNLVKDNITVGVNSTEITFACVASDPGLFQDYNQDAVFGVLGFSKGNLSLVRQLEYQRFSYCLPQNATEAATVKFGSSAKITEKNEKTGSQSIQMIDNPDHYWYYLNLTQIKVGAISISTSKYDTIIDTYFPYIYLDNALYDQTRDAILNETGLSIAETNATQELCFNKMLMMPSLELQFNGNVSVTLEKYAYVVKQPNTTLKCIGISRSGVDGLNVLGNLMQVDKNMVFDLEKKVLSFEKMKCGSSTTIPSGGLCLVVLLFSFLVM